MTTSNATFVGTAPLTRFALRRDRVRIVIWIAAIILLVVTTVESIKGLYPTQLDLDKAAAVSQDNVAAIIFNGPPQGLNTLGGQVAFQTGTFGLIVIGLMSVFMLGRLTRGEEEAGRAELLRSLPIGRHALPAAALVTVASMNVVTGLLVTLSLVAYDLPVPGSIAFGCSFMMFGLLMAGITAVAAQITENTRVVYGLGGLVIGVAFVVRAVGDINGGTLSWLSPIGWAQKTRPFAGEPWWPFLILFAATALVAWLAIALSRRRDLGAGLVPPRPGRAQAAPSLGTPLGLATRLQRGAWFGWSAGLIVLAVAYGSITDSINQFVEDNESLTDIIAAQGSGTLIEQYLAMSFRILALIAAAYTVQSVLRIRSEETATHAEQVLTTPVSRVRWAGAHALIAMGGTLVILVLIGIAFGVADAAVTSDGAALGQSLVGAIVYAPAVWVLGGLAVALVGFVPRASGVAWAALGVCFVIGMFGQLLGLPAAVSGISPFEHVPQYPAASLDPLPIAMLLAIAGGLTAFGLAALRRRDIG